MKIFFNRQHLTSQYHLLPKNIAQNVSYTKWENLQGVLLGATTGYMGGGLVASAAGAAIGKPLNDPCASALDIVWAGAKGAGVGALTGYIGGHVVVAASTLGAKGTVAYVTSGMITAPISLGLGMDWQ